MGIKTKKISAVFNSDPKIIEGSANLSYILERRYFLDIEGREIVQNLSYAKIIVSASTMADDGMKLPLYLSYFAYNPSDLPSEEEIIKDAKEVANKLKELRNAPIVNPFTGPALLSGEASGVFFHEIFGHRIEGLRMKNDSDGQTFKKMVGQYVLPADMQVFDDPTLKQYNNKDLNGYYKFDDEGIRAKRVDVVVDGKLNDFLMTRTPLDNHPKSNGHARGAVGLDPVSRQSNLVIETKNSKTEAELRNLLLEEVKRQGKEYGYFFKQVTGGFTFTGKGSINSFNVSPLEVYRVFLDGRPDELVRGVDLIGTPLSMFSNIIYAGGKSEIFTGMCGAESGSIPVTAISPAILVNKVEVQRKPKSQERPPILPLPERESAKTTENTTDSQVFDAMTNELKRSVTQLQLKNQSLPFYVDNYIAKTSRYGISGHLGSIIASSYMPSSNSSVVNILLGNEKFTSDVTYGGKLIFTTALPADLDYNLIRRKLWLSSDAAYIIAIRLLFAKQGYLKAYPRSEEYNGVPDFIKLPPVKKIIEPKFVEFDKQKWEQNIKELSEIFKEFPTLFNTEVRIAGANAEMFFTNSEGTITKTPISYTSLHAYASIRTPDNVQIKDEFSIVAPNPDELPDLDALKKKVRDFAQSLVKISESEPITEFYSGPVMFEGSACASIFNSNLIKQDALINARNEEGQNKKNLENRLGKKIVDSRISIKNYSTLSKYNGEKLLGSYEIDAEGVVPEKELLLVENGLLRNFLNGRIPTPKAMKSTGSARYSVSRILSKTVAPGTIHISVKKGTKHDAMKKALLKAAKEEGLDYAYIVKKLNGQASIIYKIDKDGNETMVRSGDFSELNLQKIKRLANISNKEIVSNYLHSNSVLSSIIYPAAIIVNDVEISKSSLTKQEKFPIQHPLERK
jgi:Predicted Zn-dependent proteases and their inactivated homologs